MDGGGGVSLSHDFIQILLQRRSQWVALSAAAEVRRPDSFVSDESAGTERDAFGAMPGVYLV
jgi:hypothetical protein